MRDKANGGVTRHKQGDRRGRRDERPEGKVA